MGLRRCGLLPPGLAFRERKGTNKPAPGLSLLPPAYRPGWTRQGGSRSPKDSLYKRLPCGKASDAFNMLACSRRVCSDVHWASLYGYPISLFIRPWLAIQEWQELRCIVKKGSISGISQYYIEGRPFYKEIYTLRGEIACRRQEFMVEHVLPHAEHADYVCDVLYTKEAMRILDYNPLIRSTDLSFFGPRFPPAASPEFRFWIGQSVGALSLAKSN